MGYKRHEDGRHHGLLELATRQHGVISTRQLAALGYGRNSASKANRVGRLRRVHRGVYMVGHEDLNWHGRCMGAVLAARPAVASHFSAAWLWGLLSSRPGTIHVTAPTPRRARRSFVVHAADLPAQDRRVSDGIPITALPRTMLDLAPRISPVGLERILERAEGLPAFDLRAIDELLERTTGHPGHGALRRALELYRPEPAFRRSTLETRFLKLVREAGLPEPAMNYNVGGLEVDAYWEAEQFVVELDVYETHGSRAAFERDRIRQEDLLLLGIGMTRVTGPRLEREPKRVMARLSTLLARYREAQDMRRGNGRVS